MTGSVEPDALKKLIAIGSLLLCLAAPAVAQTRPPAAAPAAPPEPEAASAPYDVDLQRLAEILGSLQYLRTVCGAREGQKWRAEMQSLLDAEAPSGERRRRIVARFNSGYRGFEQTYRTCTPAADLAIRRYLDEGAKISREITARYAN
ncbi:MAG: TIGR02301 family protein [Pseudolabrys sp.]|nr:TIGR02301 family protein [Pseudolabrys sp.]